MNLKVIFALSALLLLVAGCTSKPSSPTPSIAAAECTGRRRGYDLAKFNEPIVKYMNWDGEKGWMVTFIGEKEFPEDQFSVWFGEEYRCRFMIHGNYKFLPAEDNT
ncbi:MAG: hypothetical protein K9M45_01475 [Kiritimatiellales bacterium]|nr:hypothetical protein [Kiritimatiellales bacterium]